MPTGKRNGPLRYTMRECCFAVFVVIASSGQCAGIAADTPNAPSLPIAKKKAVARMSDEAIARLIADLDNSDFRVRQQATVKLSKAGASAVAPLVEATTHKSLEVSVRAVQILASLYASDNDDDAVNRTELALEQLRLSKSHSVASRANNVLRRHYLTVRRPRAVAAIKKLGGRVHYRTSVKTTTETADLNTPIQYILLGKDWKGGEKGLKYIKRLQALPQLYLIRGVPISETAIAELERELPQMMIQYRSKAYLGIQGHPRPGQFGCIIGQVTDGAAAKKAGIMPGDEIVRFGDDPVPDFETLIELIKKYGPGDKIAVRIIRRNGKRETLTVELTHWK